MVGHLPNDTIAGIQGAEAFLEIHGTIDFDRTREGRGFTLVMIHVRKKLVHGPVIGHATIPANPALLVQLIQGIGTSGINHSQPGNSIDQAEHFQFDKRFSERRRISQISPRYDDPVWNLPIQAFQDAIHDRFLTFESKRVNAVTKINPTLARHFPHSFQGIVEVTQNLQGAGVIVESLREFAIGNFSTADEDHNAEQLCGTSVNGE